GALDPTFYAVRAIGDLDGEEYESNVSNLVGCTPTDPEGLEAVTGSHRVSLFWEASSWPGVVGDGNYVVHYRPQNTSQSLDRLSLQCTPLTTCTTQVTQLIANVTYTFWVTAYNGYEESSSPPEDGLKVDAFVHGFGDHLTITRQPTSARAGQTIAPSVLVEVRDTYGNRVTSYTDSVSLTFALGRADAVLFNNTVTPENGVAEFDAMYIEKTDADYMLEAGSGALDFDVSESFAIVADHPSVETSEIDGENGVLANGLATAQVQIVLRDRFGNPAPNITPTFSASGSDNAYGACDKTDADGVSLCTMSSTVGEDKVLGITSPISMQGETITFITPAKMKMRPLLTTGTLGQDLGITEDDFQRTINVTGMRAGRWYGFGLWEDDAPSAFSCEGLPSYARIEGHLLYIDLGPRFVSSVDTLDCTSTEGALTVTLNSAPSATSVSSATSAATTRALDRPSISADGSTVAWQADLRPPQVVVTTADGQRRLVSANAQGQAADEESSMPSVSGDGQHVAFRSQASNLLSGTGGDQIYLKNLQSAEVRLVSSNATNEAANASVRAPSVSDDGQRVAFFSDATNLISGVSGSQVYLKDLGTGQVHLVSANGSGQAADGVSDAPSISANGRYVAFQSSATNLVAGASGTHIYVKDLTGGGIWLVSANATGTAANAESRHASISGDGTRVAFSSLATNLGASQTSTWQVYVKDYQAQNIWLVSADAGNAGDEASDMASLSEDGSRVVFSSLATNLTAGVSGAQVYLAQIGASS
ncbi:MAG: Ig-like domain-containing protein, partial [Bradymonadaceae bacterium]